jgi:DNA invertase Pin-like site-specific DNA recombinase
MLARVSLLSRKAKMRIGYARVSSDDQNLSLQIDALKKAGCKKIYEDRITGARADRPGLGKVLEASRAGDVVVVWRLDRLGRSLKDLIDLVNILESKEIGLTSLHDKIDTTTSGGVLVFHIFAAMAQFERSLIRERTYAGLLAARERGRVGGRPRLLSAKDHKLLTKLYKGGEHSIAELCRMFEISKPTLYSYLEREGGK